MRHLLPRVLMALAAAAAPFAAPLPAGAQLALPGAVAPTPEGATAAPDAKPAAKPAAKPKPSRRRVPDDAEVPAARTPARTGAAVPAASLAGQTLHRDGRGSEVTFALRDKALVVTHLSLVGRAEDGADCRVDVADLPLAVRDEGEPAGMARIAIPVPACPISFDVLDGAALAAGERNSCTFAATHCSIDPAGLWGPAGAALTPDRDKALERQRAEAERDVRANFKRLVAGTRDRAAVMGYAREQAQFSSTREELCRPYAGELRHGFCAARVTAARAAALRAKAEIAQAEKDRRRHAGQRG